MNNADGKHEMCLLGASVLLSIAIHAAILSGFSGFHQKLSDAAQSTIIQVQLIPQSQPGQLFAPHVTDAILQKTVQPHVQHRQPATSALSSAVSAPMTTNQPSQPVQHAAETAPAPLTLSSETAEAWPDIPPDFRAAYLDNPRPAYPLAARRMGLEGRVVLHAEVLENGRCNRLSVKDSSGHDMLDQAALQAVKNWRFVPARRGNETIVAWVDIPVVFKLDS